METLGSRLKKLIDSRKQKIVTIANDIGISRVTIFKIIKDEEYAKNLTESTINKIVTHFNVSELWFTTGIGPKFVSPITDKNDNQLGSSKKKNDVININQTYFTPFIRITEYSTFRKSCSEKKYINSLPTFPLPINEVAGRNLVYSFEVDDDSMCPKINKGDIVFAEIIDEESKHSEIFLSNSKYYILVMDSIIIIRQLVSVNGDELLLKPINDDYSCITVNINDCSVVLRVFSMYNKG